MTDKHIAVDTIRWHSVLPWLHLLRAAQLALRIRVLLLAMAAVALFSVGQMAIHRLPFHSGYGASSSFWEVLNSTPLVSPPFDLNLKRGFDHWWLAWPWISVGRPGAELFFQPTPATASSWSTVATHWTDLLWSLLVWGIFGGAIVRMHAVRFARDESVSPLQAVRFTSRLWQSFLYAPLLPFLGAFALSVAGLIVGKADVWCAGGQGGVLLVMGWLPTLASLVMALLLLVLVASWPLMVAAISIEGSDGFDGLSRAFGYVVNRVWYFLFIVGVAFGVGLLTSAFVDWLFSLTFQLAEWSVGVRGETSLEVWADFLKVLQLAVLGSYFWSATTVIYFLLRQIDDGTSLDQVYIPGPPPKSEPLPLVGVAASQQPIIERPATEPQATGASTVNPSGS